MSAQIRLFVSGEETPEVRAWLDKVATLLNDAGVADKAAEMADAVQAYGQAVSHFTTYRTAEGFEVEITITPGPPGS